MLPTISIIIPVYNVEDFLSKCLDSILQQDFHQWECILIDDGSTDNSGNICDDYCSADQRFHVIRKPNGGVSSARNEGLTVAKGDWICFVDSDDHLTHDALSHMLTMCLETQADACLCTIIRDVNQPDTTHVLNDNEKNLLIWSCLAYRTDEYVANGFMVDAPHGKLFRTSVIRNHGINFENGLCKSEDALFDAQFYHFANCIVMSTRPVYFYTINPKSICRTYKLENIPMFGTLLRLESEFVERYYSNNRTFKDAIKIRAFVALEQVLYESNANKMPLSFRLSALRLFIASRLTRQILHDTSYSDISSHLAGRSKRVDLWLIQHQLLRSICLWGDICDLVFRLRVLIVTNLKKILHISQEKPLTSIFHKQKC